MSVCVRACACEHQWSAMQELRVFEECEGRGGGLAETDKHKNTGGENTAERLKSTHPGRGRVLKNSERIRELRGDEGVGIKTYMRRGTREHPQFTTRVLRSLCVRV